MWRSTYYQKWHDKHYPLGYFPWKIHFPSSHYSTIKHGFFYSAKHLLVRDFTIRGPFWSSSTFTSYQPWQNNNDSYLHQTILGSLPKPLCYGAFFKGWHQRNPTLINKFNSGWRWDNGDCWSRSFPYAHSLIFPWRII